MARTAMAAQTPKGPYPGTVAANSLDIAWAAADATNFNTTPFVGSRMILSARNSGAGARTITFTSIGDAKGRTGDITAFSIGAGEYVDFIFEREGWQQADGALYWAAEHAEVLVAIRVIP